jgi:hypothetical protein
MNAETPRGSSRLAYAIAVLGAFLIVAALVAIMQRYVKPEGIDAERAAFRAKSLAELRAAELEAMQTPAWIDQAKGITRLRVEDAVKIVEREWSKDPVGARSNLIARVVKATAQPPKAPAKPSEFE